MDLWSTDLHQRRPYDVSMWDALRTPPSLATLFPGLPVGETAGWSVIRRSPNLSEPHIVEIGPYSSIVTLGG